MLPDVGELCQRYYMAHRSVFNAAGFELDDLRQECLIIEWQTKDKGRVLHNCKDRLSKIVRDACRLKRGEVPAPSFSSEERREFWIWPGFGYENVFEIFKTGNLNGNARFEYEAKDCRKESPNSENEYRLYIEPNSKNDPWLYWEKSNMTLKVESAVGRYLGWPW